ncbi:hypothetical protein SAMN02745704_01457 [Paucidesulfovibrio gracilis DSM 16080]|uniref:Uncharacterized protein n=1 Tax=Paucidesulfovibrio gracilis DSM 16080 TaxID=1121449 RepID=A0A1T4WWT4_9BACT|nr:hypothetical protein [Paucidesulfovibrio gracilis]SKA81832.1 hypothetical protein SAMN02745704_01457 [Paucidesulfovibrio gracilis DSM 16080]
MVSEFYAFIDPVLIAAFRVFANEYLGLVLGLVWVALLATVLGELCMAGVYFFNRRHFGEMRREMIRHNNLSIRALGYKDKESYKACNSIANEEFGRNFFSGIALFASSVWPAFFGMGWLDFRFHGVEFVLPLMGTVGAGFLFVPIYILVRIAFHKAKPWLPLFSFIRRKIKENEGGEDWMTYMDIVKKEEAADSVGATATESNGSCGTRG